MTAVTPLQLILTGVVLTVVSMVLMTLSSQGRLREGWANTVLLAAVMCLMSAFLMNWGTT